MSADCVSAAYDRQRLALVIDPRRPDTDPEMVKHFYEPESAVDYLNFLRRKKP